jgi:hypothetical protein
LLFPASLEYIPTRIKLQSDNRINQLGLMTAEGTLPAVHPLVAAARS